jgi:urease gamma subunit
MNKFNMDHAIPIDGDEVAERLKGILKATGVEMLITDARVSAIFPDGSVAYYQPLHLDTKR